MIHGHYIDCVNILDTKEKKIELNKLTNAVAADMESYSIASVAYENGIDCTVIRAISDDVDFKVPYQIIKHTNEFGEIILPNFILSILKHPLDIPALYKLGRGFNKAVTSLEKAANIIIN